MWNVVQLGRGRSSGRNYSFEILPFEVPTGHSFIIYVGKRVGLHSIRNKWEKQICRPQEGAQPPWWDVIPTERAEHLVAFHKNIAGGLFRLVSLSQFRKDCKRLKLDIE